jgi:protein gp37
MPDRLEQPLKERKPSRIFVCSMADLFHETVAPQWRSMMTEVMREADWHTFMILTKRPQNIPDGWDKPSNAWMGVTAENQAQLDARLPHLHGMPGIRFVSVEPMLGPVSLEWSHVQPEWVIAGPENGPGARPCDDAWIDELAAESPCFFDKRDKWIRREYPQ